MEGRFPCVSGVRFSFDPSKPMGERVVDGSVSVKDKASGEFKPLALDQNYTVVSKSYLLKGKDGYESFVGRKIVLDDEICPGTKTTGILFISWIASEIKNTHLMDTLALIRSTSYIISQLIYRNMRIEKMGRFGRQRFGCNGGLEIQRKYQEKRC